MREEMEKYKIPNWAIESMVLYLEKGKPMGHFLTALFANDLFRTISRADSDSIARLQVYVSLIYSRFPMACHGSYEKVEQWIEKKRKENAN